MAAIALNDVRKSYGKLEVIHGISARIADGEFIVIVGPSGCGKSTLLRMVAGLEPITAGSIAIGDRIVNRLEPKDRNIAMVFQNYALYPHMTVFDNMAYGLKIAGLGREEIAARVGRTARLLQLEPYLERKPRALSGGQRQRVAMGRALVRDPAAFLFDEPLSNLDAKLRVQMRLEIKTMQRDLAKTVLYVTHDQVEAMTLADRLIVMNGGIAEQIDTPLNVYERPATTFVAGFIGSPNMNVLQGTAAPEKGQIRLRNGVTLKDARPPAGAADFLIGIRPEHVLTAEGAIPDAALAVMGIETLGADTLLHGRLEAPQASTQMSTSHAQGPGDFIMRVPGSFKAEIGQAVPLRLDRGRLHFFDGATQRRL